MLQMSVRALHGGSQIVGILLICLGLGAGDRVPYPSVC